MILTIDIGNTTVRLCGVEKNLAGQFVLRFSINLDTVREQCAETYRDIMQNCLESVNVSLSALEGAILSSVVPHLIVPIQSAVYDLIGKTPICVTEECETGLILDVPAQSKVGVDRIVDAAWASARFPLPVVTVDMGTATTFNVVDEGGIFRGGIIALGVETGLYALSTKAAQLPEIDLCTPAHVIGKDTSECMLSGAVIGAAAMVDGMTARIEAELGKPVTLVITGGLARYVEPLCNHPHSYDPDLLPKGLALLYERQVHNRSCYNQF